MGSIIFLFEIIYNYSFDIEDDFVDWLYKSVLKAYEEEKSLELVALLELSSLIGPRKGALERIGILV